MLIVQCWDTFRVNNAELVHRAWTNNTEQLTLSQQNCIFPLLNCQTVVLNSRDDSLSFLRLHNSMRTWKVRQIAFWPVRGLPRGADYILSTVRTNTSMNIGLSRESNRPPMLETSSKCKLLLSCRFCCSTAQTRMVMSKMVINRYGTIKGSLVPQLFDSGLRFLVSVIRNDASLKYSSHGHIRFS